MKKLAIFTVLTTTLFSSICFAKAEKKHQVSLEISNFSVSQEYEDTSFLGSDSGFIPSIKYSYRHQLNQFFIRPSVSYNLGDVSISDKKPYTGTSILTPTYALKGDIGFDVNKATSIFFNAGIIGAKWKYTATATTEAKSIGALIGLGAEYSINDNIVITAKYERASVDFDVENDSSDVETISNIFGIGVGYKFQI